MNHLKKSPQSDFPYQELKDAIEMEDHLALFLKALSHSIRNGEVKKNCVLFSKIDSRHEEKLKHYAYHIGLSQEKIENVLIHHKLDAGAFSIIGLLREALIFEDNKIKDYRYLINYSKGIYRIFFKKMLKDSQQEKKFLLKEFTFRAKNLDDRYSESDFVPSLVQCLYTSL